VTGTGTATTEESANNAANLEAEQNDNSSGETDNGGSSGGNS
jgi:hypothetical protein